MLHDILNWILDFMGINNTYNSFSTHMYNFWSGFGGNISILALITTLIGVYRHNLKRLEKLKPMDIVKAPINLIHHIENPKPKDNPEPKD